MHEILIEAKNLNKEFKSGQTTQVVLNHLDLKIMKGDFTVIMGSSGAGKSTLLYALSGMDVFNSGTLMWKEHKLNSTDEHQMSTLRANKFGFVFQQIHLVSNLTLLENALVAGYLNRNRNEKEVHHKAEELFQHLKIDHLQHRFVHEVSGGEAQRAAIARAIIHDPEILFADEPTGALNRSNSENILEILTELNQSGLSVCMVTHDVKAASRASRLLYLEEGKIIGELLLPPFELHYARQREMEVTSWLSNLQW